MQEITVNELGKLFKEHGYPRIMLLHPDDFFPMMNKIERNHHLGTDRFMFMSGEVRPAYGPDRPDGCDLTKVPEGEHISLDHSAYYREDRK